MIAGIIDIGSNTVRISIFQTEGMKQLLTVKDAIGLAAYLKKGLLKEEGVDRLIAILKKDLDLAKLVGADKVYAFATAALRQSRNCRDILKEVDDVLGLRVRLLSEQEEAVLSWQGAKSELKTPAGLFMDTGGGSSELVLYDEQGILQTASMPLGSLNLYTRYVNAVLPTKQEAAKMQEAVLAQLEAVMPGTKTQTLAVTGGSMRSVRKLLVSLRWLDENSVQVKTSVLTDLIDYLLADTNRSAKHMLKIKPDRIHTFFCGLVITESAAKYIKADTIQILHSGVREGFLLSEMKGDTLER